MAAITLDGRKLADKIKEELREKIEKRTSAGKRAPRLAAILVGADPASTTYVGMKEKACKSIGIISKLFRLPETTNLEELLRVIDDCNNDSTISGILLQHPVPAHIDERVAFDRIHPGKDVDGVTSCGFGQISFGMKAFPCCTPAGIIRLIDEYQISLAGKHAVVIGRSPILGKPMAMLLLERNCTVTICHSRTKDLETHLCRADIIVAAIGKPRFITGNSLKEGVIVIDAGYNVGNVGDTDFDSCARKAAYITPVPGGVGPMTIAMLLTHTVEAATYLLNDQS